MSVFVCNISSPADNFVYTRYIVCGRVVCCYRVMPKCYLFCVCCICHAAGDLNEQLDWVVEMNINEKQ